MITADGEQDGGFELVENQQPPSGDHSDEQNEEQDVPAGTAVLEVDEEEDDHSYGSISDDYSGGFDSEMVTDDDFSDGDFGTDEDSDWEDVDEDDDSVHSMFLPAMDVSRPVDGQVDAVLFGDDQEYAPSAHGGMGFFQHGRTVHNVRSCTCHKQAADSLRIVSPSQSASGLLEMITSADLMFQRPSIALWSPTTGPLGPAATQSGRLQALVSRPYTPLAIATALDRPLTLATAHGGRVVFTGGLDQQLEVFFRRTLPGPDGLPTTVLLRGWSLDMGGMVNCLTVGMVGGRTRLIVSFQVDRQDDPESKGYVCILELPPVDSQQPGHMACETILSSQPKRGAQQHIIHFPVTMNHEYLATLDQHGLLAGCQPDSHVAAVTIGPWPCGINCAVAAPNGRHVAVVGDNYYLWLLSRASHYQQGSAAALPVPLANPTRHQHGCQYVAWSHDSRRVAVTADSSGMCVCVFDAVRRVKTHMLDLQRSMMAVAFAPWDADLLVCAQRKEVVHVVKLLPEGQFVHAALHCGLVVCPSQASVGGWGSQCLTRVITGIDLDADSRSLFVAQPYRFLQAWCPETHAQYPPRFKAAARALLLAAKHVPAVEDEHGLWCTPVEVLLHVLAKSAEQLEAWFDEQYNVVDERARLIEAP